MLGLLLGACASPRGKSVYDKPGIAASEKEADEARCTQAALDNPSGPRGSAYLAVDREVVDRCMQTRGYRVSAPK